MDVKLVAQVKLLPSEEQKALITSTLHMASGGGSLYITLPLNIM